MIGCCALNVMYLRHPTQAKLIKLIFIMKSRHVTLISPKKYTIIVFFCGTYFCRYIITWKRNKQFSVAIVQLDLWQLNYISNTIKWIASNRNGSTNIKSLPMAPSLWLHLALQPLLPVWWNFVILARPRYQYDTPTFCKSTKGHIYDRIYNYYMDLPVQN